MDTALSNQRPAQVPEVHVLGGTFVTRRGLHAIIETGLRTQTATESPAPSGEQEPPRAILIVIHEHNDPAAPPPTVSALQDQPTVALAASDGDAEALTALLAAGYDGVIDLRAPAETTTTAVRAALAGQALLPTTLARGLARGHGAAPQALGTTEANWLDRLASGWSVLEVAEAEALSERAMYRRLAGLYRRLGVSSRGEAIALAARSGRLAVAGFSRSA